ncbi:hypothetical protein [Novosphingobium sp. Chol11]|uniref:hypothetical protein n=1 Tax=Novosphingobium sp. Chol11 TaxID=1385763 RepID=UPI0025D71FCE|nr:hypothetical protein [Novosphingobium sp. Chol11]
MALLAGAAVLALPDPSLAQPAGSATKAGGQADLIFWQSVSDSNDRAQYEAYLAAFPQGLFARLAQAKINATASSQSPAASVPTPPQAIAKAEQPRKQVASRSSVSPALPRSASALPLLDQPFVEHLRAIAMTQGKRYQNTSVILPPRPMITLVGSLELPPQFCSALERNAFYENRFRPLIDRASENNAQAIAHMERLNSMVKEAENRGDSNASGALAQESRSYQPVAMAIYNDRVALEPIFTRIMAVPVVACKKVTP